MRPAGIVLVLCAAAAMAAAAPQASAGSRPIQFVCSRSECSCEDLDGLETVTCDCSTGGSNEVHEEAFSQVTQLQELNIAEVVTGPLPLDGLPDGADVVNMHITDSVAEDLRILVDKSDNVTVTDNTIKKVDTLRINARPNAHSTDSNNMTLVRNTISSMDSWDVEMTLDTIEIVNNTIGSLLAPLARRANGSYGLFLTPADEKDSYSALYRIYGNRFACRCEELKELVSAGEEEYLKDDDEDHSDGLFQLEDVYGALYSTSRCVEGNKALDQYRLLSTRTTSSV
ncbi:hypothetical protein FJT64_005988 [Amphibalanus amphitrite]|uniref:Uncharacterized protein n=1 Tax=Amphibalanus amphitrite TaxID=1232801 RepID=A0A6A4VUF8_AMPAM|nr:hypothetical protein FJT64_005988 [Amphibalanus amphitrite]